ncbi:MAG: BON domain-containing protein [Desulfobacteraceae bacterium]|nr:BON domain-containing protein [Nitrospiraceae bacterium]MDA8162901.1 BON domain-containing protein [Desulfobacteraceae bacterium]
MICEKCNTSIPDTAKFCPKCGAKVEMAKADAMTKKCPSCGAENPVTAKFCKADGYNFQQAEEKPAVGPVEISAPKDVIVCTKCGAPNPITAKFCRADGTPLKAETMPAVEKTGIKPEKAATRKIREPVAPSVERAPARGRPKTWIWLAVGAAILITAGAGAFLYFSRQAAPGKAAVSPPAHKTAALPKKPEKIKELPEAKPALPAPKITPTIPPPETVVPSVDAGKLERDVNRALRKRGLRDIYAQVDAGLVATLAGSAKSKKEKDAAIKLARSFRDIKDVRDNIQVPVVAPLPPPPPAPAPPHPNPYELESNINRALRVAGLTGISAEVDNDLRVTLKGSASSQEDKDKAFEIAKSFKETKGVRDLIFVVEH